MIILNKNNRQIILICCCIAIIITVTFYLLTFDNIFTIPMKWLSMLFLLLAEIIGTIKALKIEGSIFYAANLTLSLIHTIFVLVLSIVFVNFLPIFFKQYVLLNILLLALLALMDIIIIHFGKRAKESNNKYSQSRNVIDECYSKVMSLSLDSKNTEYKEKLTEISDLLKYSDNSSLCGNEDDILDNIYAIEEMIENNEKDDIPSLLDETKKLLKIRNIQIKSEKRGNF